MRYNQNITGCAPGAHHCLSGYLRKYARKQAGRLQNGPRIESGLLLLNLLNKFDGGATVGTLAEFSGLHRTTVRRLLETGGGLRSPQSIR
jgi:hypothetical protein